MLINVVIRVIILWGIFRACREEKQKIEARDHVTYLRMLGIYYGDKIDPESTWQSLQSKP